MRGYITYHKTKKNLQQKRFQNNIQYFDKIKFKIQDEAQRIIRFWWKLKKRRINTKEEMEKRKKLNKQRTSKFVKPEYNFIKQEENQSPRCRSPNKKFDEDNKSKTMSTNSGLKIISPKRIRKARRIKYSNKSIKFLSNSKC
mmetsp:Transcript_21513/g.19082  ORF Transcript_21513/g.19082 Transcript_21513/m.19082 type:complete len:142 (+) Transcript_21513:499-924(+)